MKIGTLVYFERENFEKKICDLKKAGFDSFQLSSWTPEEFTDDNAAYIKEIVEKHNVEISAFWCGWAGPCVWDFYDGQITIGLVPPEYRNMRTETLIAGADFAKKFGVTDIITHMGFIPEDPNDPRFAPLCAAIRVIATHLKVNGQYLLFETGQETPVTMLRCFERVGTDNLGVNLDTANLILYGKANPVDALDVLGKYVRNMHAKDGFYPTNGHDLGIETKIGEGKVDFRALFEKLHEIGYDSYVTIEREISGKQQLADIIDAKQYLSSLISEIYGH